jgi:hypothetical protein
VGRVDSVETWLSPVHEDSGQRISVAYVHVLTPVLGCTLGETVRMIMDTAVWWDKGRLLAVGVAAEGGPVVWMGDTALIMGYPAASLGLSPYGEDPHLAGAHVLLSAELLTAEYQDLTQYPRVPTRLTLNDSGRKAMRESPAGGQLLQYLSRADVQDSLSLGEMIAKLEELGRGEGDAEK